LHYSVYFFSLSQHQSKHTQCWLLLQMSTQYSLSICLSNVHLPITLVHSAKPLDGMTWQRDG